MKTWLYILESSLILQEKTEKPGKFEKLSSH